MFDHVSKFLALEVKKCWDLILLKHVYSSWVWVRQRFSHSTGESNLSFWFISIWMFPLIGEASVSFSKASVSLCCTQEQTQEHTHTHNYLRLASFWGQWTLYRATSWPPWKLRRSTEQHKEETSSPVQTQWHGNHELMSECCHILTACQIFQPWPWNAETGVKSDQSALCSSEKKTQQL